MDEVEYRVPFTPCSVKILVTADEDENFEITAMLKYRNAWRHAGRVILEKRRYGVKKSWRKPKVRELEVGICHR